jgi:hypothetical protein
VEQLSEGVSTVDADLMQEDARRTIDPYYKII